MCRTVRLACVSSVSAIPLRCWVSDCFKSWIRSLFSLTPLPIQTHRICILANNTKYSSYLQVNLKVKTEEHLLKKVTEVKKFLSTFNSTNLSCTPKIQILNPGKISSSLGVIFSLFENSFEKYLLTTK